MDDWNSLERYRDEDGFVTLVPRHPIKKVNSNRNLFARSLCDEIIIRHGHIAITNYKMGDNREFEKSLSVWDPVYFKYRLMSGYYVESLREFRIGRGYDLRRLVKYFPGHSMRVDNDAFKADSIGIDLYVAPRDDYQKAALTFTACQGQYGTNDRYTQQMLELSTGSGKGSTVDSQIPTPNGLRRFGDLKVGDFVYNKDHKARKIQEIFPLGVVPVYTFILEDGKSMQCTLDHMWMINTRDGSGLAITSDIKRRFDSGEMIEVPVWDDDRQCGIWTAITSIEDTEPCECQCILIDDPDHLYIAENNIITHNTYLAIATTAFYSRRVVVFAPFSKLLKQWKDSFLSYVNFKDDEVLMVKGSDMCEKIRRGKYKHVKAFIFSVDTVASYQKHYGDEKTMDMLEMTNAYIKIIDECHKDMKTIAMIEALSNFRLNLYLSASPGRSEQKEQWIFSTVFKNVPKFGEKFQTQDEHHVNMMVKKYFWTPDSFAIRNMVSAKTGLNTKAYETELINAKPASFESSIDVICGWMKSTIKPGKKILFMAQTVAMLNYLQPLIEKHFPGETAIYYGGMKPKDKEKALEARVIIGTSSSLGTGADIKGLQFNWNVGTYANKIDANQFSGRTRAMDDAEVVYGEFVNFGWLKTARQFERRKPFLLKKAKNGKIMFVN